MFILLQWHVGVNAFTGILLPLKGRLQNLNINDNTFIMKLALKLMMVKQNIP